METLTVLQLEQIKTDMDEICEMLTEALVLVLAQKVNEKVNIPFLSESKELKVFFKIIRWIDKELYKILPNEYYELIHDSTDGISEEEAENLRTRLVPLINKVIDIPILPEGVEAFIIDFVLNLIIKAMIKGFKLEEK